MQFVVYCKQIPSVTGAPGASGSPPPAVSIVLDTPGEYPIDDYVVGRGATFELWGGGGAGGSGTAGAGSGYAGGGGAAWGLVHVSAALIASGGSLTVGIAGSEGSPGGDSIIHLDGDDQVRAAGGTEGHLASVGSGGVFSSLGTVTLIGSASGSNGVARSGAVGGKGGDAGGPGGGTGGAGGIALHSGTNGTNPGGGGGGRGSGNTHSGGDGGTGRIVIYLDPA